MFTQENSLTQQFSHAPWVEKETISSDPGELSDDLVSKIKRLYCLLPYHSWEHVEETRQAASTLVSRCKAAGVEADQVALDHAIICHDLLYAVEPRYLAFGSREEFAARYAYTTLRELGAPEAHARKVENIILATHAMAEPKSVEEILMRAADLSGIAGEYEEFKRNTHKLHAEAQALRGREIPFKEFVINNLNFLSLYAWRYLELTPQAHNQGGSSVWHSQAMDNITRLFAEAHGGSAKIQLSLEVNPRAESMYPARTILKENELYIGVEPDAQRREELFALARRLQKQGGNGVVFFIP